MSAAHLLRLALEMIDCGLPNIQVSRDREPLIYPRPVISMSPAGAPAPFYIPLSMLTAQQFRDMARAATPHDQPCIATLSDALKVRPLIAC
jgi:hypothetical protein